MSDSVGYYSLSHIKRKRDFTNIDVNQFLTETADLDVKKYPGVTRVLSATDPPEKKAALARWRKRVGEKGADRILKTANAQGSAVDKLIDDYISNVDIAESIESVSKECRSNQYCDLEIVANHFTGLKRVLDSDRVGTVYGAQVKLRSEELQLDGIADIIGFFDNKLSVIDIKTSRKAKKREWMNNYCLQETAYALMFNEMTKLNIEQIVTVMAVEEFQPVSGESYVDILVEQVSNWSDELNERCNHYHSNLLD